MNNIAEYLRTLTVSRVIKLRARQYLFKQGDSAGFIFLIDVGHIKLLRDTIDGNQVVIHSAKNNQSLAEAALFSQCYHCHAYAEKDSEVFAYTKQDILTEIQNDPAVATQLMALLARQVQSLRLLVELRNIRSAKSRILQYCTLLANKQGKVEFDTTLKDVADSLGVTHETLYRKLSELEDAGLISRSQHEIHLNLKK